MKTELHQNQQGRDVAVPRLGTENHHDYYYQGLQWIEETASKRRGARYGETGILTTKKKGWCSDTQH